MDTAVDHVYLGAAGAAALALLVLLFLAPRRFPVRAEREAERKPESAADGR